MRPLKQIGFIIQLNIDSQPPSSSSQDAIEELCQRVLDQSRTSLMMSHRYLNVALWHMPFVAGNPLAALSTDGKNLYYEPLALLSCYQRNPKETSRDVLHSLLHCIFRHPFDQMHANMPAWDLTCDIIVEAIAADISQQSHCIDTDEKRTAALEKLNATYGKLGFEDLYELFEQSYEAARIHRASDAIAPLAKEANDKADASSMPPAGTPNTPPAAASDTTATADASTQKSNCDSAAHNSMPLLSLAELRRLEKLFYRDDHYCWYQKQNSCELPNQPPQPQEFEQLTQDESDEWETIAKKIEAELQSFSQNNNSETLLVALNGANQRKYDYRNFLQSFASLREDLRINDEEFDYVYYTYGLQRYKNMPLIEPLEYCESNRVREFVIAIDTSGSVKGETVRQFVLRTCEILRETESFGSKVEIHIIQCDLRIRNDVVIRDMRDIDAYVQNFELQGFGGTDFRPVFDYVHKLRQHGQLTDLAGLIYFTDGRGTFPTSPPDFKTAFVFLLEDEALYTVPPWAMKVVIDKHQLQIL